MFEYQYPDVHGHFGRYGGSFASETLTHALTELREAYADGTPRNWKYTEGTATLSARMEVNQLPSVGAVIIGQIHAKDNPYPFLKLSYRMDRGVGYLDVTLRRKPSDASSPVVLTYKSMPLDTSFRLYWVIVPITIVMLLGAANLFRTRIGRAFIAIRDRDISAEVLGIPLLRYKLLSFGLSSFYAGVAGGLWAYFFRVVTPESFPLLMSIFFLAAIIVGGMGSILGGILGAVFMTMVPELLKLVFDLLPNSTQYTVFLSPVRTIIFGLLIIGFLVFEPHGLAEVWRRIRRFFHLWPFRN